MSGAVNCPSGHSNPAGSRFCNHCGVAILIQPEPTEVVYWNVFMPHWDQWNETFGFMISSVDELMNALNQSCRSRASDHSDLYEGIRVGRVRARLRDSNRVVLEWYAPTWVVTETPKAAPGCVVCCKGHWELGSRITDAPNTISITCLGKTLFLPRPSCYPHDVIC